MSELTFSICVAAAGSKLTSGGQTAASHPEPQGEVRPHSLDQQQASASDFLSGTEFLNLLSLIHDSFWTFCGHSGTFSGNDVVFDLDQKNWAGPVLQSDFVASKPVTAPYPNHLRVSVSQN